jgi:hypothetical protein
MRCIGNGNVEFRALVAWLVFVALGRRTVSELTGELYTTSKLWHRIHP